MSQSSNNNTLLTQHEAQLIKSGISSEVIQARGYRSVTSKQELTQMGFASFQQQIPALLIPQFSVDGNNTPWGYQIRPDRPRMSGKGKAKPVKYEFPAGAESHLDINPLVKPMLKDTGVPLWFTEGAKKADALTSHGQCAINLPGVNGFKSKDETGSSVLMADFDYIPFNDRLCYLCFDSDWQTNPKVKRGVNRLAEHLKRKGAAVVFIRLPMSGVNKNGIDDYLADGHSIEDVKALSGPDLDTPAPAKESSLPKIVCNNVSLDLQGNDALKAIIARNSPPVIFIRNRKMVKIAKNETNTPIIVELDKDAVRCVCAQTGTYINKTENDETEISPPLDVVENAIAKVSLGLNPFPVLRSLAESPYITADGTIVTEPDYNPKSQIFYSPALDFNMPEIPESPDSLQVEAAKNLLLEVIVDFPFDSNASRTNCIATMMTPPLRPGIKGCCPLAIFDKPQPRTGASLLSNVVSLIGTGRPALMLDWPHDDAELQKALATFLRQGQTILTYDNATGTIVSPAFSRILTAPIIAMRLLGGNDSIEIPNQHTWIMTGNNLRLNPDLVYRSYRIGLDAQSARPGEREIKFKHDNLLKWVGEERGRIIAAILTVYRAWVNAGQPKATTTPKLAGFQEWADLMSAILEYIGMPGFLANLPEMYDTNDTETPQWEGFITAWYEIIGNKLVTVPEIVSYLNDNNDFTAAVPDSLDRTDKNFNKKLGIALSKKLNVRYPCGLMIKIGKIAKHNLKTWQIELFLGSLAGKTSTLLNVSTSVGSVSPPPAGKNTEEEKNYSVGLDKDYPHYPSNVKQGSLLDNTSTDADNPAPTEKDTVDDVDPLPPEVFESSMTCSKCHKNTWWVDANGFSVCNHCHPKDGN